MLKKALYRTLTFHNYLKVIRIAFFIAYYSQILRFNKTYKYHYYLKRVIKKGDTILDIGANLGYYTSLFSHWIGKEGRVYAIEPLQFLILTIKKRENIRLMPYALGEAEKRVVMINYGAIHNTGTYKVGNERGILAEMKQPSKLFQNIKIDFIKIDTEGYEGKILEEMKEIIKQFHPKILTENKCFTIRNLLYKLGYKSYYLEGGRLKPGIPEIGDVLFC